MTTFKKMILLPAEQVQDGHGVSTIGHENKETTELIRAKEEITEPPELDAAARMSLQIKKLLHSGTTDGLTNDEKMTLLRAARNLYNKLLNATLPYRQRLQQTVKLDQDTSTDQTITDISKPEVAVATPNETNLPAVYAEPQNGNHNDKVPKVETLSTVLQTEKQKKSKSSEDKPSGTKSRTKSKRKPKKREIYSNDDEDVANVPDVQSGRGAMKRKASACYPYKYCIYPY